MRRYARDSTLRSSIGRRLTGKAAGVYRGRKPSVDVSAVQALRAAGKGPAEIAKELGIGRTSVYRALEAI